MRVSQHKTTSQKLAEINFIKQLDSGQNQFNQAQLENANLANQSLLEVKLIEANLNYANLEKCIFTDSDLQKSSLIGAKLKSADINRVNFSGANLDNASLSLTKLTEVNLTKACLTGVSFYLTKLNNVNLSFTNLCGAFFHNVDLSSVQLKGSYYNDSTYFPCSFNPTVAEMIHESNIESLDSIISRFNLLCITSNRYLGNTITAKILNTYRPDSHLFNQLKIDRTNQIIFPVTSTSPDGITPQQLYYFETWMDSFIQSCSKVIKNFPKLIK